jgi:uncharacterized protein (TIGR03067 family)
MLQGNWTLVGGEQSGVAISEADLEHYKLTIDGNQHRVSWSNAILEGTHELDTSQTPMTIDSKDSAGPFEGMCLKGIFELNGDELTICFANPGEERPARFTTQDGDATILHKWKRRK